MQVILIMLSAYFVLLGKHKARLLPSIINNKKSALPIYLFIVPSRLYSIIEGRGIERTLTNSITSTLYKQKIRKKKKELKIIACCHKVHGMPKMVTHRALRYAHIHAQKKNIQR